MKKYLKIILPIILILGLGAAWYAYSEYNRGHKDLTKQKADTAISATALLNAFANDETTANATYLDKAVAVTGTIIAIDKDGAGIYTVLLGGESALSNVSCQMDERHNADAESLAVGSTVTIKGVCTGMLMDVVMIRCTIDK